jgi:TolA-binding protein
MPAAPALAQGYGQPYPLNQYPPAAGYPQPYAQPYPVAPQQQFAPPVAPQQPGQLSSREGIALQNQLLELRRDLQALQAQGPVVRRGSASPPSGAESDLVPQLLDRVSNLEEEVRRLRGQVEEAQNQLQRQQQDFSKQLGDLQFQSSNRSGQPAPLEGDALSAPPAPPQQPAPPPAPRHSADLALQEANAALARRDYSAAATNAHDVLSAGRTGPRAGDAQLVLAQALTGKKDYQGAAVAYGDAYQRLKGSSRGQDALLGLATSLNAIGEKQAACGALDQLQSAYPVTRHDVRDAASSLRGRSGCR